MTESFTASNGIQVEIAADGVLVVHNANGSFPAAIAAGKHIDALREFFRHEEDERLGRWRDPKKTDRVVSEIRPGVIHVYNEKGREYGIYYRGDHGNIERSTAGEYGLLDTAERFFDAHPEPKPWHDAKPEEGWLLTIEGSERVAVRGPVEDFIYVQGVIPWSSPRITDGRLLWGPEDAS